MRENFGIHFLFPGELHRLVLCMSADNTKINAPKRTVSCAHCVIVSAALVTAVSENAQGFDANH